MSNGKVDESNVGNTNDQELSLSAALLAPLNSIFEAQVQSARAFLNFILQMGFRHRYSEEEERELDAKIAAVQASTADEDKKRLAELQRIKNEIKDYNNARIEIEDDIKKSRDPSVQLNAAERI